MPGNPDPSLDAEPREDYDDEFDRIAQELEAEKDREKHDPDPADADDGPDEPAEGSEPQGADPVSEKQPEPKKAEPDIWSNATPEQRAAYEAAQRELDRVTRIDQSNRGRISHLQKTINQITGGDKPPERMSDRARRVRKETLDTDALKQATEDYGEVAAPIVKALQAQQEIVEEQARLLDRFQATEAESVIAMNEAELAKAHPDWGDIQPGKPLHAKFLEWYQTQPAVVQQAIERNGDSIVDPVEASYFLGRFKQDIGLGQPAAKQPSNRRQEQLRSSQVARSTGPGSSVAGVPDDFDTAFNHYAEKAERRRR